MGVEGVIGYQNDAHRRMLPQKPMKTKIIVGMAALAVTLTGSLNSYADSGFTIRDARNNTAVAASPRAREQFPWLTRAVSSQSSVSAVSAELKNGAYAKSPRVLEQYPELTRVGAQKTSDACVVFQELLNRGFAESPRAKEEFPTLRLRNDLTAANCETCLTACVCCSAAL
jgi:hypothetical protein